MTTPFFRISLNISDKIYYLHYSSTLDNLLFNRCYLSAKKWKKRSTAEKWINKSTLPHLLTIEKIIFDDCYAILDNDNETY